MKRFAAAIMLALAAMASPLDDPNKPYISAVVKSRDYFHYGRFVTGMQGSDKRGTQTRFFT